MSYTVNHVGPLAVAIEQLAGSPARPEIKALLGPLDDWAISAQTADLLAGLVEHLGARSVLEFGAGRSSVVLAATLQAIGRGRLTSIEHQPRYAELAWQQMTQFPSVDARLVKAGLAMRFSKHGLLRYYTGIAEALRTRGPFDFVFIDGPPGHLGRDATLLAAAPFLAADAVVLLDDATRPQEQTAVRRWERALPVERVFESETLGRGVIVLKLRHPATPSFSLRTFAGTIHDRLIEWRYRH